PPGAAAHRAGKPLAAARHLRAARPGERERRAADVASWEDCRAPARCPPRRTRRARRSAARARRLTPTATRDPTGKGVAVTDSTTPRILDDVALGRIDAYWRAANYLSVGQIYLLDNPLLREPLRPE